jgi:uncharacterized protein
VSVAPWIQTRSGIAFDLVDPRPSTVDLGDIAFSLAHINRFTGHVGCYSVAQHSVLVSHAVLPEHARVALMHDAHEAYVGDISSPLKTLLPGFKAIEQRVWAAIAERFDLQLELPGDVKRADLEALMTEARDLLGPAPKDWGIDIAPWPRRIDPWPAEVARLKFLDRARELGVR